MPVIKEDPNSFIPGYSITFGGLDRACMFLQDNGWAGFIPFDEAVKALHARPFKMVTDRETRYRVERIKSSKVQMYREAGDYSNHELVAGIVVSPADIAAIEQVARENEEDVLAKTYKKMEAALQSILIRCEQGDLSYDNDWREVIAGIASEALKDD